MKQAEKSLRSRERILSAALEEFGENGYAGASLNTICAAHGISKGLLYHYYENKDALYLHCVQRCYEMLTAYLEQGEYFPDAFEKTMEQMLSRRAVFFRDHPWHCNLFFDTMLQPPGHLSDQIRTLRQPLERFNTAQFCACVEAMELRPGIGMEDAMEYFLMINEMYNAHYRRRAAAQADVKSLAEDHERKLATLLDMVLFGIAKERG